MAIRLGHVYGMIYVKLPNSEQKKKKKRENLNEFGIYANYCEPAANLSLSERSKASLVYPSVIERDLQAFSLQEYADNKPLNWQVRIKM